MDLHRIPAVEDAAGRQPQPRRVETADVRDALPAQRRRIGIERPGVGPRLQAVQRIERHRHHAPERPPRRLLRMVVPGVHVHHRVGHQPQAAQVHRDDRLDRVHRSSDHAADTVGNALAGLADRGVDAPLVRQIPVVDLDDVVSARIQQDDGLPLGGVRAPVVVADTETDPRGDVAPRLDDLLDRPPDDETLPGEVHAAEVRVDAPRPAPVIEGRAQELDDGLRLDRAVDVHVLQPAVLPRVVLVVMDLVPVLLGGAPAGEMLVADRTLVQRRQFHARPHRRAETRNFEGRAHRRRVTRRGWRDGTT